MPAALRLRLLLTLILIACIPSSAQSSADNESKTSAKVGNGVSAPKVIYHPDPEYSEKGRQAKFQGVCVLWLVVGTNGIPHDIKVARSLGMGLDEKAIEAVKRWRFAPALKDGKPVAMQINVEVSFRLYGFPASQPPGETKIEKLQREANAGDTKAELELAQKYFDGQEMSKDAGRGMELLEKAARQGSPSAQFMMGERIFANGSRGAEDYIEAYMWYAIAQRHGHKCAEKLSGLEATMSQQQLTDARSRIEAWPNSPAK
jgi:TonB family protein